MTDKFERDPIEDAVRDSLAAHAAKAPRGDLLAERIITAAGTEHGENGRRAGWRTWTLPAIAAAAVAGVVATVVAIQSYHPSSAPPAGPPSRIVSPTPELSTPSGVIHTSTSPSPTSDATGLTGVKVLDVTFVSANSGWALASADCLRGPGRCTALLRTTDGTTWKSMPGAQFDVPGVSAGCTEVSADCVTHIRFADDQVGYAFGPSAFFMTLDGGASWQRQDGGAIALETLDNNVIRVTATPPSGCPGPCNVQVETSAIGSTTWTPADLPGTPLAAASVSFARGVGGYAYLLSKRNPAGGAGAATSTLYRSSDSGRSWKSVGEPCPPFLGQYRDLEADSLDVAGGADGRVAVLCMQRSAPQGGRAVATSTDGGATFALAQGKIAGAKSLLAGDPDTVLVAAGSDGLSLSSDGGSTWAPVAGVRGPISFVGFESSTVGRAVSADGRTIWTTRDGGASWRAHVFG